MQDFNKVNIRLTHPNLYKSLLAFAAINISLGLNFFFSNPTFNPYMIDKDFIGSIFFSLGVMKLVFLVAFRNLKMLRVVMSVEIMFMMWWGFGASITFFQGRTSLQLPILYAGLSALETFLLLEPIANPVSVIKKP